MRDPGRHNPRSRLVAIEQTVNRGGGAVWPLQAIEEVAAVARRHGLAMHMDGARILNAVVASGIAAKRMAAPCDSAWLDSVEGAGLSGRRRARGVAGLHRRGMGVEAPPGRGAAPIRMLAAAGIHALDHNVERLGEDHGNARRLAEMIGNLAGIRIMNPEVETNIVSSTRRPAG